MTIINKRSRMVSVRLSDDEFRKLHEVCETLGARSISDLARDAMQRLTQSSRGSNGMNGMNLGEAGSWAGAGSDGLEGRLRSLDERVAELQRELARLQSMMAEAAQ